MIKFINGPAIGQVLQLRRAPKYLRVVHDGTKWDGLDQIEDSPRPEEKVYAYIMVEGSLGHMHVRAKPGSGLGGLWPIANYQLFPAQPDDATIRDNAEWTEWVINTESR